MPTQVFTLNNMVGGMNTMAEPSSLQSFGDGVLAEATNIQNFTPIVRGGQRTERGYTEVWDSGVVAPIRGIYRYYKPDGTSTLMTAVDGDLISLSSTYVPTTVSTALDASSYVHFETAYGYLVYCDGVNYAKTWDGVTVADLTTDVTAPRATRFYLDRLFVIDPTNQPGYVYHSDVGAITTGYASNFVKCDNQDSGRVTAIDKVFYAGDASTYLVVGKNTSLGIITGTGTVDDPFVYNDVNRDAGVYGFRSLVQFNQDLAYLTGKGVSSIKTDLRDVGLQYNYLSSKVQDQFQLIDPSSGPNSHTYYDWKNSRIRFFIPTSGESYPNIVWNWDSQYGGWYKTFYPDKMTASYVDIDGTVYLGSSTGKIYVQSSDVTSFASQAISSSYTSGFLDFGAPHLRKRVKNAWITAKGNGNYDFTMATSLDYGTRDGDSGTIDLSGTAYVWGGGVWTADPGTYQWGAAPISITRFIPRDYFYNMQFEITIAGVDTPLDLYKIVFEVEYMETR